MLRNGAVERYARALFELAVEEGRINEFSQDLQGIHQILTDHSDLEKLLYHPRIRENEKKDLMKRLLGDKVSPLVLNFIMLTIDKGRETLLKSIIEYYEHLAKEAKGIVEVQVYTAFELTSANEAELTAKLQQMIGKSVELQVTVDRSLIGGMKLRIGDRVIDGTIQRHLERLQENLTKVQVSQLEVS